MQFVRRHWPVLLICVLPLFVLYRAVLLGEAIGPFDNIHAMMAGKATPHVWDVLQADAALQFYAWRDLVFHAWQQFKPPFWNPYSLMGTPLLANSQSGGFYPLHIVVGVLHLPTALGISLLAWFHLAWGGLGVRFLSLKLGANEKGAAVAGALFCVSPFMVSWVGLASVVTTVSWIPWALGLVYTVCAGGDGRRAIVLLGVCIAMMFLGGHLQFAAYGTMAVLVCALWQSIAGRSFPSFVAVVGSLLIGGMLASPQLLPVLEFGKNSHRQGSPSAEGYAAYVASSIKPYELAGAVMPGFVGRPDESITGTDSTIPLPRYWPGYARRGANFAESAMYLGPFLLLLIAGLRKREQWSKAGGVACAGAVGLLLAFGTPLNAALYYLMPGWSATGSPGRAIALFVIAACALAGIGWPAEEDKEWRRRSMVFGAVVAMLLALGLLLGGAVSAYSPEMNELLRVARAQCLSAAFPLLLLCLVLCASIVYLWQKGPKWLAIGVVCVGQLLVIGTGLIPTSAVPFQRGTPDPARRVAFVNDNWDLRIGVPVSVPPNVGVEMGLYDVAGYDSLLDKDTVRHLHEIDGQDPAPPANGNMMFIKPGADTAKLAASGVTEVWRLSDYSLGAGGQLIKEPVVGPGRASLEGGTAKITYDGPTSQTVETQGAGTLVVRDRKMEGWSATLDGKPATIEGTLWRDIEVPAGTHKVRFIYVPPGLMAGLGLMGLAILACIGLGWRRGEA